MLKNPSKESIIEAPIIDVSTPLVPSGDITDAEASPIQ